MMKWIYGAGAVLVLVLLQATCESQARPIAEPADIAAVADALKYLQELDRYYSQIARPRYARSGSQDLELSKVERAIKLLQLHHLDRFYSHHSRPRFGKRSDVPAIIPEDEALNIQRYPANWFADH